MSKGKWKEKPKKISPTMERLLGLYEQQLVRLSPKRNLQMLDTALYRFLENFPEKKSPDDFSSLDVAYFKKIKAAEGEAESETNKTIEHVRAFFYFLEDYLDYPGPNPASERSQSTWLKLREQHRLELQYPLDNEDSSQESTQNQQES